MPNEPLDSALGVLLIGHGTRDATGTAQFLELGQRLRRRLAPLPVEFCLLEFQRPSIEDAWRQLASQTVLRVRVTPLLLFAAGHAKQDIPDVIARCQNSIKPIEFSQSKPISRHAAIVDLALDRLGESLQRLISESNVGNPEAGGGAGDRRRIAVVMVGRGNRDPCAQADMRVLAELIAHRAGVGAVHTAFYAMAEPKLPDVLDHVATSGDYDAVVVQPHLLFEGRLYQAIARQAVAAQRQYPHVQFVLAGYLGPDERVIDAIVDRIQ